MSTPFSETTSALRGDGSTSISTALLVGLLVLGSIVTWASYAQVRVFEVSDSGRIESTGEVYRLTQGHRALLIESAGQLGDYVRRGDLLFAFDIREQRQRLEFLRGELERLPIERAKIAEQSQAWQSVVQAREKLVNASVRSVKTREQTAARLRDISGDELDELSGLAQQGAASRSSVRDLRRAYEAAAGEVERQRSESDVLRSRERVAIEEVSARVASLEQLELETRGREAALRAEIRKIELEIERAQIRAPIDGRIGERATNAVGAWVESGSHLATLVPEGEVRCTAYFQPGTAIGRLATGQVATVRLDGFPWTQFGTVAAVVERVSRPSPEKAVEVVLRLDDNSAGEFPVELEHGMTASVEVEVERATPAELLLRAAGLILR